MIDIRMTGISGDFQVIHHTIPLGAVMVASRRTKVIPLSLNVISIRSMWAVQHEKTTLWDN